MKRGDMPASPCQQTINRDTGDMTIREAISARMMAALRQSGATERNPAGAQYRGVRASSESVAKSAIADTDALLAELERTGGGEDE